MQPKVMMGMYSGPDKNQASHPRAHLQGHVHRRASCSNMVYKPASEDVADQAKWQIYRVLARKYRFDPDDERALGVWDTRENQRITGNIALGIQMFLGIIGALTLFVGGMGVANIMYAVVKERTREIGVKMALGAKVRQVMSPFVLEALVMTVIGGTAGHRRVADPDGGDRRAAPEGRGLRVPGPPHLLARHRRRDLPDPGHGGRPGRLLPRAARRQRQPRGVAEVRMRSELMISMREIRKVYSMGRMEVEALRGVDLDIAANEYVAVVGPSGSGKSTLMNILGCLDTPTSGEYLLSGEAVGGARPQPPGRDPQQAHRLRVPELQPAALRVRAGERRAAAAVRRRGHPRAPRARGGHAARASASRTAWSTSRPSSPAARCSAWPSRARW